MVGLGCDAVQNGSVMSGIDDYLERGRAIAEEQAAADRANKSARMNGRSPWARLLNRWILLATAVGFPLGYLVEMTPEGAFAGALMLGGATFILTFVAILFRVSFGSHSSGAGASRRWLGGLPQWTLFGGLFAAAVGAGIGVALDGAAADVIAPALRLAPVGAAIGFLARAIALIVGTFRAKR